MDVDALYRVAEKAIIDTEEIKKIKERLVEAEARFEEKYRAKAVTQEFLSRTYSL